MKIKLIASLLLILFATTACWITTENGRHSGQVTALEQNGLIFKTWTAYVKSDVSSSQEDAYCVEDEKVVEELMEASRTKKNIVVGYHDEAIVAPWRCNSESGIIDKIL